MIVIAAISGALGQAIVKYSLGGWLVTTGVGFVGALIGYWLAGALGLPFLLPLNIEGQTFPLIWAIIGSALFTLVVSLVHRYRGQIFKR
jgi:uncharacterized membrane protein YeaQ/YmgE (transglycosylase-associated protein family)